MRGMRLGGVCLAVVVIISVGACGGRSSQGAATPTTPVTATPMMTLTPTPTSTPTATATAKGDLADFVEAARRADTRLRDAATLVNASVRSASVVVDVRTAGAVKAAEPVAVRATIPAGMPSGLLTVVLTVYSDLDSRYRAMSRFSVVGDFLRGQSDVDEAITCLANGSRAAARFAADLAAVVTVAGSMPPLDGVDPASRASAEVAVRVTEIRLHNGGCASCGGYVATTLSKVTWDDAARGATTMTGSIGRVPFTATYVAGGGWTAELRAC